MQLWDLASCARSPGGRRSPPRRNGQFARAIDQDPDIEYVIPKEGSSLFLDSLVIPAGAPHPELAPAFIDFTLEAEIAAEI